jgi:hypothetical protein
MAQTQLRRHRLHLFSRELGPRGCIRTKVFNEAIMIGGISDVVGWEPTLNWTNRNWSEYVTSLEKIKTFQRKAMLAKTMYLMGIALCGPNGEIPHVVFSVHNGIRITQQDYLIIIEGNSIVYRHELARMLIPRR